MSVHASVMLNITWISKKKKGKQLEKKASTIDSWMWINSKYTESWKGCMFFWKMQEREDEIIADAERFPMQSALIIVTILTKIRVVIVACMSTENTNSWNKKISHVYTCKENLIGLEITKYQSNSTAQPRAIQKIWVTSMFMIKSK